MLIIPWCIRLIVQLRQQFVPLYWNYLRRNGVNHLNHSSKSYNLSIVEKLGRDVIEGGNVGPLFRKELLLEEVGYSAERGGSLGHDGEISSLIVLACKDFIDKVKRGGHPTLNHRHFETTLLWKASFKIFSSECRFWTGAPFSNPKTVSKVNFSTKFDRIFVLFWNSFFSHAALSWSSRCLPDSKLYKWPKISFSFHPFGNDSAYFNKSLLLQ